MSLFDVWKLEIQTIKLTSLHHNSWDVGTGLRDRGKWRWSSWCKALRNRPKVLTVIHQLVVFTKQSNQHRNIYTLLSKTNLIYTITFNNIFKNDKMKYVQLISIRYWYWWYCTSCGLTMPCLLHFSGVFQAMSETHCSSQPSIIITWFWWKAGSITYQCPAPFFCIHMECCHFWSIDHKSEMAHQIGLPASQTGKTPNPQCSSFECQASAGIYCNLLLLLRAWTMQL